MMRDTTHIHICLEGKITPKVASKLALQNLLQLLDKFKRKSRKTLHRQLNYTTHCFQINGGIYLRLNAPCGQEIDSH